MRRARLLLLFLLSGCSVFLPREKEAHRVCTERQPIYADDGSGRVLAWVVVCYTVYRTPGVDPNSLEGEQDAEIAEVTSDTTWVGR